MLFLPSALLAQIAGEAQAASPRECCGLIEGAGGGQDFHATALHPALNLAAAPDRFEIDPAAHFAAVKAARENGHAIIGCYHSHPQGRAEPSRHDVAGAQEENFLWLIAGPEGVKAFAYSAGGFEPVKLILGADLVTSSL